MEIKSNLKSAKLIIDGINPSIQRGIEWGAKDAELIMMHEKDKQIIDQAGKSGVEYRRHGIRRRRSAAGQTPSEESGAYRKSFEFVDRGPIGFTFGTTSPYGGFLDDGTSKMQPRNALSNIFTAVENKILNAYRMQIERSIKI